MVTLNKKYYKQKKKKTGTKINKKKLLAQKAHKHYHQAENAQT